MVGATRSTTAGAWELPANCAVTAAVKLRGSDAEICWPIVDWAAAEIAVGTGPTPKTDEPEARALASGCKATVPFVNSLIEIVHVVKSATGKKD